jgi:hypothetical protein
MNLPEFKPWPLMVKYMLTNLFNIKICRKLSMA